MSEEKPSPLSATAPLPTLKCAVAAAPFNKPLADTILRSCDDVNFYVFKGILVEASPFFEGLFSLPQTDSPHAEDEYVDGRPVIRLTEPSKILRTLLLFCYPVREPTYGTDEDICAVLEAARKYDMDHVAAKVRALFLAGVAGNPYRIYTLAHARCWYAEMRIAAKATLSHSLVLDMPARCPFGMENFPLGDFYRLREYQQRCVDAVAELVPLDQVNGKFGIDWLPARPPASDWAWLRCQHHRPAAQNNTNNPAPALGLHFFGPAQPAPAAPAAQPMQPFHAPLPLQPGNRDTQPMRVVFNGTPKYAAAWWVEGVVAIAKALKQSPRGATALRGDLFDSMVSHASRICGTCLRAGLADLRIFLDKYAALVEEAVSDIELEIRN